MNSAKRMLSSFRFANSLYSTQLPRTAQNPHFYSQVTTNVSHHSPLFTPQPTPSFHNTYQIHFFSSQSQSVSTIDHVLLNNWSKDLENELSEANPTLTHETVMYVLMKLDKDLEKCSKFFSWVTEKNGFKPSSAMYSLMLRIYANMGCMKDFWHTITKMKERGFYIDEETYKTVLSSFKSLKLASDATALTHFYNRMVKENTMDDLVKQVVEIVRRADWGPEIERNLSGLRISVSDNFVMRVLRELRANPFKALRFFRWLSERLGFEHNTVTYNAVLRVLGQNDSIGEFWNMIKEMKDAGYETDLETYIKVSRRFQKFKMFKEAVELYELMIDGPFKPSVQDCSVLLRAIAAHSNPDLDLVFRVVKKYEAAGYSLSKTVYDGIHRSLTSAGRFDRAEEIVGAMRNCGYEPDNITYSQLVFGLCKARRLEEACEVLDLMAAEGCMPDVKTWTILIQGHCLAGEVDNALLCLAKMVEKNCDADADLLDVLVNGFLSQKRTAGAYKLLVEMVNKAHMRPWQATYKNLIDKLLGERLLEEALDLLRLMKRQNHPPFPEPFVQYISKFGNVEDASEFLKVLSVKKYPTVSAYQHVFESFFQEGRHSEAKDLLYNCPHHIRKHKAISSLFGSDKSSSIAAA